MLDDWQRWILDGALSERPDGRWSAFEVGLICPRQNGKNAILEAVELAGLFLFGERLIVHSAHRFDTAQEHFLRMQTLIDESPDLRSKVARIATANGKEAIILRSGARLKFIARARGGARGFTGDRVVLDEAYDLPPKALGNMIPALSARTVTSPTGVQVWYTSSAPHAESTVLHAIRARGHGDDPADRLFYAEWGNEPEVDPGDRDGWYAANPALGVRISEEFVADERRSLPEAEFARERLGVAELIGGRLTVIPLPLWRRCADRASMIAGPPAFAVDVSADRTRSSIAVCGRRADGRPHVEVVDNLPGTDWIVPRLMALMERHKGLGVVVQPLSPAGSLIGALEASQVPLTPMNGTQHAQACGQLHDEVVDGSLVHLDQDSLFDALVGARKRTAGDAWVWDRRNDTADITPIVAVTLARWGLDNAKPAVTTFEGGIFDLADY